MGDSSRLYVVGRAGNHQLLTGLDDREILHWSPDGKWMAFHRDGNMWVARVVVNPSTPPLLNRLALGVEVPARPPLDPANLGTGPGLIVG